MNLATAAAILGRAGGRKKSKRKTEAVRANAKLPRPGRRKKTLKAKKANNLIPSTSKTAQAQLTTT